jgi:hypothetical protein
MRVGFAEAATINALTATSREHNHRLSKPARRAMGPGDLVILKALQELFRGVDNQSWHRDDRTHRVSHVMLGQHISIDRAWILIAGSSPLSVTEGEDLEACADCRGFLMSFVSVARFVGFLIDFPRRDDGSGCGTGGIERETRQDDATRTERARAAASYIAPSSPRLVTLRACPLCSSNEYTGD